MFGTINDIQGWQPAVNDREVSEQMMDAWLAFARTGDPNINGSVQWPRYDLDTEISRVFDTPASALPKIRDAKCDLWDTLLGSL